MGDAGSTFSDVYGVFMLIGFRMACSVSLTPPRPEGHHMDLFKNLAQGAAAATDWLATRAIQAATSPNPDGWSDAQVSFFAIVVAFGIVGLALAAVYIPNWCRDLAEQRPTQNDDTSSRTLKQERVS